MAPLDESRASLPSSLGPYIIRQRIAVGGMSELFLAEAPQEAGESRSVVVKRMLPRVAADPSLRQMFADEAALGARILHPNVVRVLDHHCAPGSEQPYLVMEYVPGMDLWRLGRNLTRAGTRMTPSLAVYVARQMLAGLEAVHEARDDQGARLEVVHRDVSPSNVLISIHGEVKLGDLGIALAAARSRNRETGVDAHTKGKLGYLAPEQVRGRDPDQRSDLFSAAVVTAELLMGRPLFSGGSELAVLLAIRDGKINPFLDFSRDLEADLAEVVTRALAPRPSQRPPNAAQFLRDLGQCQSEDDAVLSQELSQHVLKGLTEGPTQLSLMATPTRTQRDATAALNAWAEDVHAERPGQEGLEARYQVRTAQGQELGPWSFAKVVKAVSTERIGPDDEVLVNGAEPRPLRDIAALARHLPVSASTERGGRHPLSGDSQRVLLGPSAIVHALTDATRSGFTGLLLCERDQVRKEVYLRAGAPTFVTSNQPSEMLGEHLVARGVITQEELDGALAVMPRFEGRLGETLAGMGLVEPVLLFGHIDEQVRQRLLDLYTWTHGHCTQYHGVAPPESSFPLEFEPWETVLQGMELRIARGLEATWNARCERQACAAQEPELLANFTQPLPAEVLDVWRRLTPDHEAARLWQDAPSPEAGRRAQRALLLLSHLQAVTWLA